MIARTTTSVSHAARAALAALAAFVLSLAPLQPGAAVFEQTNLVSSVSGLASHTDANLKNPWGIAFSATGPFWVANQVTNKATVYNGAGQPFPTSTPLVVTLVTSGGPTGLVFNATSDFQLFTGGAATFLFATLSGSIEGWNPGHGTMTEVRVLATDGASYTGLAPGNNGSGNFLYAADTANNKIDIYDAQFQKTSVAGSFTDPVLPAGFTVYNIQNLAGTLFVTYENESAGGGIVDAFDLNGNFLRRVTANAAGGPLDSPWGLVIAPASFGPFGGALLVGNEGNGRISAFNPVTGQFLGQLLDAHANPIANPGLWGLIFGNGGNGGETGVLYFAAGIDDEQQGLFGSIRLVVASGCVTNLSGRGTPAGRAPARVDLTWTALAGAARYDVLRGTASGGPYVAVGTTTNNYFSDAVGLVSGTTYYYVLQPRNAANVAICQSNEARVTIPVAR